MKASPFWSLWGWPIVMGVLTTTGLITALVSDTWGDWWSWVGLGIPVVVMGWTCWPRTTPRATAQRDHDKPHTDADEAGTNANATPL